MTSIAAVDSFVAVAFVKLFEPPLREPAGGDLRTQIAHRSLRKADVVGDHLQQLLVRLAGFVDLELIDLQPFGPRIGRAERAKAGRQAADIHPMRANGRKRRQLPIEERTACRSRCC